jgi:hypothetical protein
VDESKPAQSTPATSQSAAATNPAAAAQQAPARGQPAGASAPVQAPAATDAAADVPADPGFLERGGLRRRLRFLRKARELAYRDLGGLIFEMHRLGQRRDDLVAGKLATLGRIDGELRAIEVALRQQRGVTVLREAGVTACARCAAIHSSEDRFCPACGFSLTRHADRPIAGVPVASPTASQAAPVVASAPPVAPVAPAPAGATPPATPLPPPASPPPPDETTQITEPPTQIVRPSSGEPPVQRSKRA